MSALACFPWCVYYGGEVAEDYELFRGSYGALI